MEYSIGIDIGGTKIAAAVVGQDGHVLHRKTEATATTGQKDLLNQVANTITDLTAWCEEKGVQIRGAGVGTAGQVNFAEGTVVTGTTNIKDWNDVPLRDFLHEKLGLPIWVDNDVNVFTVAEQNFGSAVGEQNVICLALGTGVGGGLIVNGQLVHGVFGAAGELGHISIDLNGPKCNCGFRGCLEMYASGTGIARLMQEKAASSGQPRLDITSREVFQLYKEGKPIATEVVNEMTDALAFAIVSLIHTFNPAVVVLGGGVMQDGEWLAAMVRSKVVDLGIASLVRPVRILTAQMGVDASVIGAAYQCWLYQ